MSKLKHKKALCFLYNSKYFHQGNIALSSAKKYNSDYDIVHLTDDITGSIADHAVHPSTLGLDISNDNWMIVGRVAILEYCLKILDHDCCILVDGDTYTYDKYDDFQHELDSGHSLVIIPHLLKPLPEDNKYPQNRTICLAGNYNSGFVGVSQKAIPFIEWWKSQTALYPKAVPEAGLASEQGWLRFAGDFDNNVKIFRHPGYNVAYWNVKEREVKKINNQWFIDDKKLCLFHFSGFKQHMNPSQMSVFQNRYFLSRNDPVYELFDSYKQLVWG